MCFRFINAAISLPWFLNSLVLEGYYSYLLDLKTSENTEHGSVRTKRVMFGAHMGVENSRQESTRVASFSLSNNPAVTGENKRYTFNLQQQVSVRFYLLLKC